MIQIDIPMPEHCYDCPCHDGESAFCQITGKYYYDEIPRSCPLVELPSAQPERKKGEWIYKPKEYDDNTWECSKCGESWVLIEGTPADNNMNFCPKCGADMRGEKE